MSSNPQGQNDERCSTKMPDDRTSVEKDGTIKKGDYSSNSRRTTGPKTETPGSVRGELQLLKDNMLTELSKFTCNTPDHSASDFLYEVFRFCNATAPYSKRAIELFTMKERLLFKENIQTALPKIEPSLYDEMYTMESESVVRFRKIRSGLQFLEDELVKPLKDPTLEKLLENLHSSEFVEEIKEKLVCWKNKREGEGLASPVKNPLPESHAWWPVKVRDGAGAKSVEGERNAEEALKEMETGQLSKDICDTFQRMRLQSQRAANRLQIRKRQMLKELSNFTNDAIVNSACDLLCAVFRYCIACAEESIQPTQLFTSDKLNDFKQKIGIALPEVDRSLFMTMDALDSNKVILFRKVRSGLEYLKDNLVQENTTLSKVCNSGFVREINKRLEQWKANNVEGKYNSYPKGLRFLPSSHDWWLEQDRTISEEKWKKISAAKKTSTAVVLQ